MRMIVASAVAARFGRLPPAVLVGQHMLPVVVSAVGEVYSSNEGIGTATEMH